jgi:hypothetical protein
MPLAPELSVIDGALELYDWFGKWPTFHDAEIVSLHLNRRGLSSLFIHTWDMTNEVDERGFYVLEKHVVVELALEDIVGMDFDGFNHQNVISGLDIEKKNEGFVLTFGPCYGLAGTIEAKKTTIRVKPGRPSDSLEIE